MSPAWGWTWTKTKRIPTPRLGLLLLLASHDGRVGRRLLAVPDFTGRGKLGRSVCLCLCVHRSNTTELTKRISDLCAIIAGRAKQNIFLRSLSSAEGWTRTEEDRVRTTGCRWRTLDRIGLRQSKQQRTDGRRKSQASGTENRSRILIRTHREKNTHNTTTAAHTRASEYTYTYSVRWQCDSRAHNITRT